MKKKQQQQQQHNQENHNMIIQQIINKKTMYFKWTVLASSEMFTKQRKKVKVKSAFLVLKRKLCCLKLSGVKVVNAVISW